MLEAGGDNDDARAMIGRFSQGQQKTVVVATQTVAFLSFVGSIIIVFANFRFKQVQIMGQISRTRRGAMFVVYSEFNTHTRTTLSARILQSDDVNYYFCIRRYAFLLQRIFWTIMVVSPQTVLLWLPLRVRA